MECAPADYEEVPDAMIEWNFFFHEEKCTESVTSATD